MKKVVAILFPAMLLMPGLVPAQQLTVMYAGNPVKLDWSRAGYPGNNVPSYPAIKNILDFGADNTGSSANDVALNNAINSLSGSKGVILFPAGIYLFNNYISLRSGLILRGAGSSSTTLLFNLGGNNDLININGSPGAITTATSAVQQFSNQVTVADPSIAGVGSFVKVYQENDGSIIDLSSSSWADNTVGQISYVKSKQANNLNFFTSNRRTISLSGVPKVQRLNMVTGVGIECLKIKRLDASAGQTTNIAFNFAAFCWIKGIESDSTNFAHVAITNSSNIEITGCYFHGSFAYGSGGQGYGVVCQYSSGDCLVENNIFKRLRHAMLIQAGANGNIYAYNYSIEQKRTEIPADASQDIVLHGNYPYANLLEGNIAQNIGGDASHSINGPANVFFRNRALYYGISFSSGSGDSSVVIYNEVTATGNSSTFPFLSLGNFSTNGSNTKSSYNYVARAPYNGSFTAGNEPAFSPNGTVSFTHFNEITRPYYFSADLQPMGYPVLYSAVSPAISIPARDRYVAGTNLTYCDSRSRKDSIMPVECNPLSAAADQGYDAHDISESNEFRDNSNCGLITTIIPSGISPVTGMIHTKVGIDASVQSYNGKAYVQRHYDIEPVINPSTATAQLIFYFTQAEFDNYNAANGTEPDLPTGPSDILGKSNLRITQYHGTGTMPGNYSGSTVTIDPDDANINWNAITGLWEVSIDVSGFSGFYVKGGVVILPLKLISFDGMLQDDKTVMLQWKVGEQQGIKKYVVERSQAGSVFENIGSVTANNEQQFIYHFIDNNISAGISYYRLKVIDDEKTNYSKTIIIKAGIKEAITVYPTPAQSQLKIRIRQNGLINTDCLLIDTKGRLLQRIKLDHIETVIDPGNLSPGIYYLKTVDGRTYKFVKL